MIISDLQNRIEIDFDRFQFHYARHDSIQTILESRRWQMMHNNQPKAKIVFIGI